MFSFLLRIKRRIKRILKVQSETRMRPEVSTRSRVLKALILILTTLVVALFFPADDLYSPLDMPRAGDTATQDIIAPFPITVFKADHELREGREQAGLSVPYVLNDDSTITLGVFTSLHSFAMLVDSLRLAASETRKPLHPETADLVATRFPMMSLTAITKALSGPEPAAVLTGRLQRIYSDELYKAGVLQDLAAIPEGRSRSVIVRRGEREMLYQRDRLLDIALANARLLTALNRLAANDSLDVEYYYLVGRNFIQPNLWLDMPEYERRVKEQVDQVSVVKEIVNTGDIIVRQGRKVGEREDAVLTEMARLLKAREADSDLASLLPMFGRVFMVLACFGILYLFLYLFRGDVFRSNPKLLALLLVFLLQLFLIYAVDRLPWERTIYLYPVAVLPIMITILFDAEVGLLSTVVLAVLLGLMQRFNFTLTLMTLVIGTVACLTSRRVRKRTHFFRIVASVAVAHLVFILIVESLKLGSETDLGTQVLFGVIVAVLSSLLTIGFLPFFESAFSITTDITLLELSDPNHPLLKRLALEAPGTYSHSISVGNLCEAAAKAIGANPLLARVGSYYHDIGKIEIPEYFVENQLGVRSRHEALAPSMSALVLAAHVKRGRMLGEEADIPDDVLNFIEEHHGTIVMSYFYNKALEQGADPASIDKFRYPGPKPQVRETGIAMLADAVEAASRTLDDPKPARIQALIQKIMNDRFQSGELDECPLTLRDLARIREAFTQILIGAFHHRIAYPRKD